MEASNLITASSIKYILNQKGWIEIPASGASMYPIIRDGDICRFEKIREVAFTNRDILLFHSSNGQLVGHRFSHHYTHNGVTYYIFKGDTNYTTDSPITSNELIGRLTLIKKKLIPIRSDGWLASLWTCLISQFPLLPVYCKRFLWRRGDQNE